MALKFASEYRERYGYSIAELCRLILRLVTLLTLAKVFGGCSSSTPAVPTWLNNVSQQWHEIAE